MSLIFLIIFFMTFGWAVGLSEVKAQSSSNADLHPPYLSDEAMTEEHIQEEGLEYDLIELQEGEELEEGEEGEIVERGLRRFYKRKRAPLKRMRPRIKRHRSTEKNLKRRVPLRRMPRVKRRPLTPLPGSTPPPPDENVVRPGQQKPGQPPKQVTPPELDVPRQCVWHTTDIMDQRIDVSAQVPLMSMMSRGGDDRRDASAMIGAVKEGKLAGILLPPRKAVSDRGKRLSPPKGYWQLIPSGQLGTCWQEPAGEPPMILYRDTNGEQKVDSSVIEHTLRTQWAQCGLKTPEPPCAYLVDLVKPTPKPGSPEEEKENEEFSHLTIMVTGRGLALSLVNIFISGKYQTGSEQQLKQWAMPGVTSYGVFSVEIPSSLQQVSISIKGAAGMDGLGNIGFTDTHIFIGGSLKDQMLSVDLDRLDNAGS